MYFLLYCTCGLLILPQRCWDRAQIASCCALTVLLHAQADSISTRLVAQLVCITPSPLLWQYDTAQYDTAQYDTAQYDTAQYDTAQCQRFSNLHNIHK